MKQRINFLLRFFTGFLLMLITLRLSGQDNPTATWVAVEQDYQQGQIVTDPFPLGNYVQCQLGRGFGTTEPAYYSSSLAVRLYAKNTLTFNVLDGASIRKIEMTCKKNGGKSYLEMASVTPIEGELVDPIPSTSDEVVVTTWTGMNTKGLVFTMGNAGQRCLSQIVVTYTTPSDTYYQVTYNANGGVGEDLVYSYAYNSNVRVIASPYDRDEYVFGQWNTEVDGTGTDYYPGDQFAVTDNVKLYAQWITSSNLFVDVFNPNSVNEAIGDAVDYNEWEISLPDIEQPRVTYKGKTSKNVNYIQMNSTISGASSYSGIVTTCANNLKAKKLKLKWHSMTDSDRILEVYGKNTPYSGTPDLYGETQGTLLASIVKGQNSTAELVIEDLGSYSYLGFRSNSGALYLSEIRIIWETLDTTVPVILFEPSTLDLGNVVVNQPMSTSFTVSQANLTDNVALSASSGTLSINGTAVTEIPVGAVPTTVTWTYTPTVIGSFEAQVTATSGNTSSNLGINANVLPTSAQTLHQSKENFVVNNIASACINLADVEVVGQSGSYLYLQDAQSGVLVFGSGAPSLHTGDKFVSGYLQGTYENYHGIIEIKNFQFINVETTTVEHLTSVSATVDEILTNPSAYDARYVELSDVTIDNWSLSGNQGVLPLHDKFQTEYATKTAPETTDLFTVKGLLNGFYSNNTTKYQIDPVALTDISTTVKAGMPSISPRGTETTPSTATTVLIGPATNTVAYYRFGDSEDSIRVGFWTYINLFEQNTVLKVYGTRDFYTNSDELVSYYTMPTNTYSVKFSINGVIDESDNVLLTGLLDASQTPSVTCLGDFSFVGWSLSEDSTETIALPYTVTDNITLYAVYVKGEEFYYQKVNDMSEILNGEYVILAECNIDKFALKNCATTRSPAAYSVNSLGISISGDGILQGEDMSELTWTFRGTGADMTITSTANPSNHLYIISNSSTGVRVGQTSESTSWSIAEDLTLTEQFNMKCNGRYLLVYNEQDWRSYLDMNSANSYPRLQLFKKHAVISDQASRFTRVFWDETATADMVLRGPSIIPSGYYLNMGEYNLTCETASHFIIEDDARFKVSYNNTGIMATVQKNISGYVMDTAHIGWHLLSSPMSMSASADNRVEGLMVGDYDLYAFDQTKGLEWRNEESVGINVVFADQGSLLYANKQDVQITFIGELTATVIPRDLVYVYDVYMSGWNLIGNPYTNEGYLNIEYTGEGECEPITSYIILRDVSENGKKFTKMITVPLDTPIAPMEGVMIQAPGPGYKYWIVNSRDDASIKKPNEE